MSKDQDTEGLKAKRDELLAEVKDLKAKLKQVSAERDEALQRAESSEAEINAIRVDGPVDDLLKDVFTVPPNQARKLLDRSFTFQRTDEGLAFRTADGEPVEITEKDGKREAGFNREDIQQALIEAGFSKTILLGSRASGAGHSTPPASRPHEPEKTPKFGLR